MILDKKEKIGISIVLIFILGILSLHTYYSPSPNVEIKVSDTGELNNSAGYSSINLKLSNNEERTIQPRFYTLGPEIRGGPHRLLKNKNRSLKPGETKFAVSPHEYTYLSAERGEKYMIIMKDMKSGKTVSKTFENDIKIDNTTIRNTNLVSFRGKPPGWKERFTGGFNGFRFDKSMQGVTIERFTNEKSSGSMGYYLVQDLNLTEYIAIESEYSNLSDTSTGFRILRKNESKISDDGIIETELTELHGKTAQISKTYDIRKIFQEKEKNFTRNKTVQLQFFYKSRTDQKNSFFIDRIEPANKKPDL